MTTNSKHKQIVACIRKQLHNVAGHMRGNIEEKQLKITLVVELHFVSEQIHMYKENILNIKTAKVLTKTEIYAINKNLVDYVLLLMQISPIFVDTSEEIRQSACEEILQIIRDLDSCLETSVGYINHENKFVYVFENKRMRHAIHDFSENGLIVIKKNYNNKELIRQIEIETNNFLKHFDKALTLVKRQKTHIEDNTSIIDIKLESGSHNRIQN